MSAVFRHSLTRLRAPLVENAHGNLVRDWAAAASTAIPGWAVDAGDTRENVLGRDGVTVEYTARARGLTVDVSAADRIEMWGSVYEVVGEPLRQPGPSATTSHTIVSLKRAEG